MGVVRGFLRAVMSRVSFSFGLALSAFTLINVIGGAIRPGFDVSILAMPLAPTAWWGSRVVVAAAAVLLAWSLVRPLRHPAVYVAGQALLGLILIQAATAILAPLIPVLRSEVSATLPPLYAFGVAGVLTGQVLRVRRERRGGQPPASARTASVVAVCVVVGVFLLAQLLVFGPGQHAARADCIIVMGAGTGPRQQERVRTGCRLFKEGYGRRLIFSGGPLAGSYTEPVAMSEFAVRRLGVPRSAILLDEQGHSTYDTARSCRELMARRGWESAVVVTHEYHVSRTWMTFRRAGVAVSAQPARRFSLAPARFLYSIGRESVAWLWYFVRPLGDPLGGSAPDGVGLR